MLAESFIHMLNYREENIRPPVSKPFTTTPDGRHGSLPSQVEGVPESIKPMASVLPESRVSRSMTFPNHMPYISLNRTEKPVSDVSSSKLDLRSITDNQPTPEPHTSDLDHSGPQYLRVFSAHRPQQVHFPDDGYLVMDSSITLNGEPATNSMLNFYLDQKLQEVYSQYLQERLACPESSLGPSLLPQFHQASLNSISRLRSTDSSLEPETRRSQRSISQRFSSHFSSPVLRISNPELNIKPQNND
ncbi:uncharacterized protein LOC134318790 [Trichomycterus rosablanca]|uniref:uncharacterized protein LOC134318790 n=1 Tax=Trichomycterus rosablanca TaxID=2290929 RepID=UPI002F35592F